MDESSWKVPKDVDRPLPFLAWEMQDLAIGMGALTMGMVIHQFLAGLLLFAAWMVFAKKAAAGAKRGQMTHFAWRNGVRIDPALRDYAPPPNRDEYL